MTGAATMQAIDELIEELDALAERLFERLEEADPDDQEH